MCRTPSPTSARPSAPRSSGAILIAVLTSTFLGSVASNPAVPKELSSKAQVELSAGIPFVSDADLNATLEQAGVPPEAAAAVVDENAQSRINGLRAALAVLALIALLALVLTRRFPPSNPGTSGRSRLSSTRNPPDQQDTAAPAGFSCGGVRLRWGQLRRSVTLHQARLRQAGQVMRWSKRRRGSHTPSGNWKISRSSTPTELRQRCCRRACALDAGACHAGAARGRPRTGTLPTSPRQRRALAPGTREQGPLTQGIRRPVAPCCGHVVQAVCMAS